MTLHLPRRPWQERRVLLRLPLFLVLLLLGLTPAPAQQPARTPAAVEPISAERKREREQELRQLEEQLKRGQAENSERASEISRLRGDRARLASELIATAQRVREAETSAAAAERRLAALMLTDAALKRSLEARRGTIVEVLASLQRLGRKPPPAVLVRPEDMLLAIRTSMLLSSVLPELRQEAQIIAGDLQALIATRDAMTEERDRLAGESRNLLEERHRLASLIDARQGEIERTELKLGEERQKIRDLVRQSANLKELIGRMETEIASVGRAAAAARAVPPPARNPAEVANLAPGALGDMARLQPKIAFADTRGTLVLPASGRQSRQFGAADGFGGRETGVSLETDRFAVVTTPIDGWVSFAGSYRSFGQVLIINAGGGYHLVLLGLERISVEAGQFVLTGEPVASMGTQAAGALTADAIKGPVLYIELRKDGTPIDPGPWWAKSDGEKVRG
ncbi:MAG: murein hydrolase activator EnvC family protein [Beijerinckiaceae bacterium]